MSDEVPAPLVCQKHPGAKTKKYFGRPARCMECANEARKARDARMKAGEPSQRPSKPELRERKAKIAAMAGAAVAPRTIAQALDCSQTYVEQVITKDLKHDEFLQSIYKQAEKELAPKALDAARKLIAQIDKTAEGYEAVVGKDKEGNAIVQHVDTAPQHAAQALREMRPFIGMGDRAPAAPAGPQGAATLQIHDPKVAVAMMKALRDHRVEQQMEQAKLVAGERVE